MLGCKQIFCPIRKKWVAALPEEVVRQSLIQKMTQQLGYPMGGFVLEKDLKQMPHLQQTLSPLPNRRADIVFFAKNIHPAHPFYPLLLIECKSIQLNPKVIRQTIGYNFYLQACFIAIANGSETLLGWHENERWHLHPALLSYSELCFKWNQMKKAS